MTRKLTPARLDELEAAAKKATQGPWEAWDGFDAGGGVYVNTGDIREDSRRCVSLDSGHTYPGESGWSQLRKDAAHIAMMEPATTLALVAEVRELRAKVERVRALHRENAYPDRPVSRCRDCDDVWPCETARALGEEA